MFSQLFFGSCLWEINSKQAELLPLDTYPGHLFVEEGSLSRACAPERCGEVCAGSGDLPWGRESPQALPEHPQHGQHVLQIPRIYGVEKLELGVHPPSLAPAGLQSRSRGGNVSVLTLNTNNDFKY